GKMKTAVVGLGAMGGYMAARMLAAGLAPVALVTPRHLEPLRAKGLRLISEGRETSFPITASSDPQTLGEQDLILLSVKATSLPGIARVLGPMIGRRTLIVAAMNGVPWWFFHGLDESQAGAPIQAVDPGGVVSAALPPQQCIGCVLHLAASMPEPGLVAHAFGNRILLGDPMARGSGGPGRAGPVVELMLGAGMGAVLSDDIHAEVWYKLWGNMTMNPVSAITGATMDVILKDDDVRAFMSRAMIEAGEVSRRVGITLPVSPEERHKLAAQLGAFKTSMLQDVEAMRPIELDALVGSVIEIAMRLDVDVPNIRALMGLARLRARQLGLY
ncbi:MAG TPA: 2-dehydropantoate 2-reductase, partial [Lautropia sp.]|nr:2-dehydropantoate 2-reductase [Lautropia sp.]